MSVKAAVELPISVEDLLLHAKRAMELLAAVNYQPRKDLASLRASSAPSGRPVGWVDTTRPATRTETMKILDISQEANRGDALLEEHINAALNAVKMGLQVGLHMGQTYMKFSNLETLRERNRKGQLNDSEITEWNGKNETTAAITVFTAASYVLWRIEQMQQEELSAVKVDFAGLPEPLALSGQVNALQGMLYHLGSYLKGAQTGLEFLKLTQAYFKAVQTEVQGRSEALRYAEIFTDKTYRLEKTTFRIDGFTIVSLSDGAAVEFKRVEIEKIVGNTEAKGHARRIAQFMMAYDFETRMNPLVEFGAFPWVYLYKGIPGTGKTLLLGATLTLVHDHCAALDVPFRPHPMPNTIISTFQGGSGENMQAWMQGLFNPAQLVIGIIDDAENALEDRTRQGISAGVREVIGVFLRMTEGATAIVRGNAIILIATNIPDQIDKAVMSRVLGRADVDGARRREDFLDQMRLWGDGLEKWQPGLAGLSWPSDYAFLSAQGFQQGVERAHEAAVDFKDHRLAEMFDRISGRFRVDNYDFYANLFVELRQMFPFFSSRDIRNIQTAVTTRLFDFDFPDEWFHGREAFVGKPYQEKRGLILELARKNMRGVRLPDVLFTETAKYVDTMVSILDGGRNRRIDEMVETLGIQDEAQDQYRKKRS